MICRVRVSLKHVHTDNIGHTDARTHSRIHTDKYVNVFLSLSWIIIVVTLQFKIQNSCISLDYCTVIIVILVLYNAPEAPQFVSGNFYCS